ncbi:MAG: DUF1990 domain-containing protein [Pirellulaceae bacterium]
MLTLFRPTAGQISEFLKRTQEASYTYDHIGATRREALPHGFDHDHHQVLLGRGQEVFQLATNALQTWKMIPASMAEVVDPAPVEVGQVVGLLFRTPACWSVSPCRVVYILDDESCDEQNQHWRRFAFGNGTLPGHVEAGEERFQVAWNLDSNEVWYSITAFSKPNMWLVKLGYLYARRQQARFRKLSGQAMQQVVASVDDSASSLSTNGATTAE